MKIGYARVSTRDQNLDSQIDALKKAGCEKIYQEKKSGKSRDRPELTKMLENLREGDTVVILKLTRLGRSLKDLIDIVNEISAKDANFVSLVDGINTDTAHGKLAFNIFGSFAEFTRELIVEGTMAGLEAAKKRGRKGGRPKGLSKQAQEKARLAESYYKDGELTVSEICRLLNISKATFYRYLNHRGVEIGRG